MNLNNTNTANDAAEDQLIHALLLHHSDQDQEQNRLIETVLNNIDQNENTTTITLIHRIKSRPYRAWLSLAASFLVVAFIGFIALPTNVAMASVENMIERLESIGDRMYLVEVGKIKGSTSNTEDKPRLQSGKLYLRGTGQFVFYGQRDNGSSFFKGKNQLESWQISNKKGELLVSTPNTIKLPLPKATRDLVFLDILSTLESLKKGYEITLIEDASLPNSVGSFSKLVAQSIDSNNQGARYITIYFDSVTYDVQRLVFDRVHLPGDRARVEITLDLKSNEALPYDFFESSYHTNKTSQAN